MTGVLDVRANAPVLLPQRLGDRSQLSALPPPAGAQMHVCATRKNIAGGAHAAKKTAGPTARRNACAFGGLEWPCASAARRSR